MSPFLANMGGLSPGKLIATAPGKTTSHALATLQDRGRLFISPGEVRDGDWGRVPGSTVERVDRGGDCYFVLHFCFPVLDMQ